MNLFYRKYILFLISVPLLIAGNSNVSNMKKMAVDKVEDQAKLIEEMGDKIYSFGELGFQEFETSKYLTTILEENGFKGTKGHKGPKGPKGL